MWIYRMIFGVGRSLLDSPTFRSVTYSKKTQNSCRRPQYLLHFAASQEKSQIRKRYLHSYGTYYFTAAAFLSRWKRNKRSYMMERSFSLSKLIFVAWICKMNSIYLFNPSKYRVICADRSLEVFYLTVVSET